MSEGDEEADGAAISGLAAHVTAEQSKTFVPQNASSSGRASRIISMIFFAHKLIINIKIRETAMMLNRCPGGCWLHNPNYPKRKRQAHSWLLAKCGDAIRS